MFGLAAFGDVPFGGIPSAGGVTDYFLSVSDVVTVTDSRTNLLDMACARSDVLTIVESYTSPNAIINTETLDVLSTTDFISSSAIFPVSVFDVLPISDEPDFTQGQTGEFHLFGEATLEFVGTTKFIDMIEQGEAYIGIAVEIRTRSL